MTVTLNRRRFIAISAAALGLSVGAGIRGASAGTGTLHRWNGTALGARASILLHHPDAGRAQGLLDECVREIARLEAMFSIYRADSALSYLNRDGRLDGAPLDLIHLLGESRRFSRLSAGAFDISVQPLFALHARYRGAGEKPSAAEIDAARALVDYRQIEISTGRIAFARPGMALTLNGIAQGYITDRVAELLRARAMGEVLVNLGEVRGLGRHPSGRPWHVGLENPPGHDGTLRRIELNEDSPAVATSAAHGHWFGAPRGRFGAPRGRHHLLDPASGASAMRHASVSVCARNAMTADALSTALAILPLDRAADCLQAVAPATAYFTAWDGVRSVRHGQAV